MGNMYKNSSLTPFGCKREYCADASCVPLPEQIYAERYSAVRVVVETGPTEDALFSLQKHQTLQNLSPAAGSDGFSAT